MKFSLKTLLGAVGIALGLATSGASAAETPAESAAYSGQVLAAVLGESTLTPAVAASPSQAEPTESRVRLSYAS